MVNPKPTELGHNLQLRMEESYECSKCLETKLRSAFHERKSAGRSVTNHCRECRARRDRLQETYRRALKRFGTVCLYCLWPSRLITEDCCRKCLKARGLRRCTGCSQVLLVHLDFHGDTYRCRECRTTSRRAAQAKKPAAQKSSASSEPASGLEAARRQSG